MKRYFSATILLLIFFVMVLVIPVSASEKAGATIKLLSENKVFSPRFETEIKIEFLDKNLYNKDVFVSYHVYDEKNNELLFEGLRLPIKVDESYNAKVKFSFDLSKAINIDSSQGIDLKKYDYLKIKFDMVDQKNIYWFSLNKNIKFNTCEVVYENKFFKKFGYVYQKAIEKHPIIFIVNLVVCLGVIYLIFRSIKKYNS
jgi:hypothetical protein